MALPIPDPDALAHSQRLAAHLREQIAERGGWLSFADFMGGLLYAPGLGYYTAGAQKFGAAGDFVTAPEMTPLFGRVLGRQLAQIMALSSQEILEIGAGSGRLAADVLLALEAMNCLPEHYRILDVSADLRERQRHTLEKAAPDLVDRVEWLDALPDAVSGAVIGNELLDAMPAQLVVWQADGIFERGVTVDTAGEFIFSDRPAQGALLAAAEEIADECELPDGYVSEISLANRAWAASWGKRLERGAMLLPDYGFPRREYYHPQRNGGTLMCHYRHQAHTDPFLYPGLQDVTVHVDFTAIIAAAHPAGLELLGYAPQGQFLINCGILDALAALEPGSMPYIKAAGAVGKLVMPHEMGELFKVIALGKGLGEPLIGFTQGDASARL